MFNPSREQVRELFFETWPKYRGGEALAGMETIALEAIFLHPEYHTACSTRRSVTASRSTSRAGRNQSVPAPEPARRAGRAVDDRSAGGRARAFCPHRAPNIGPARRATCRDRLPGRDGLAGPEGPRPAGRAGVPGLPRARDLELQGNRGSPVPLPSGASAAMKPGWRNTLRDPRCPAWTALRQTPS